MLATTRRKSIRRRYADFRRAGESAVNALRSARIEERFEDLEERGLVRIVIEPDDSPDLSFLEDDYHENTRQGRAHAKEVREMDCEQWAGQFRLDDELEWTTADSICGCIGYSGSGYDGNNRRFSGYWSDIQAETIRQYTDALKRVREESRPSTCEDCGVRPGTCCDGIDRCLECNPCPSCYSGDGPN